MDAPDLYGMKNTDYFGVEQTWVADLVPETGLRVLDVGCGDGATGALLKQTGQAAEVHGIELVETAAARARAVLDSVIAGNIEALELPYAPESFDCIIATELLEHLVDPWRVLHRLAGCLKPGGWVVASSPNIRYIKILALLAFRGEWQYAESGILDQTHLRFFTRGSFAALFSGAGLEIDVLEPIISGRAATVDRLTLHRFTDLLCMRYKCRARKLPG